MVSNIYGADQYRRGLLSYFLIKFGGISPCNPVTKFVAAVMAILNRVSLVAEPIWGSVTTLFMESSGLSFFTGS